MPRGVRLEVTDGGYVVRLTVRQTNLIRESLLLVAVLTISPERMAIQFGFADADLHELAGRMLPMVRTAAELTVTARELRMIYLVLWQVPEMFGTEEAFHIRLGFFTEEAYGLAREVLHGLDRATRHAGT